MSLPVSLTPPSHTQLEELLREQATHSFTYPQVGTTADDQPPAGWPARRRRVTLPGPSQHSFSLARAALQRWTQYDLGWTSVPMKPPIEPGQVFATQVRTFGLWSLHCCRIVYVVDEPDRFGYAIGTLPHHAESGEERFLLQREGNTTTFEISSFSRGNLWIVRLGWWYGEHLIRRFLRDSTARMCKATEQAEVPPPAR